MTPLSICKFAKLQKILCHLPFTVKHVKIRVFRITISWHENWHHFTWLLPPTKKLGQGYVFTRVCDSVHRGECLVQGGSAPGVPGPGGSALREGVWRPPVTATAAGSTHPTGMHSCYKINVVALSFNAVCDLYRMHMLGKILPLPYFPSPSLDLIISTYMLVVGYYNFDVDLRSGRKFVRDEGVATVLLGTWIFSNCTCYNGYQSDIKCTFDTLSNRAKTVWGVFSFITHYFASLDLVISAL